MDSSTGVDFKPKKYMNESGHFMNCNTCGKPLDMRDLGQVFSHGNLNKETGKYECLDDPLDIPYSSSMKVGDNVQWTKDKKPMNLN